MRIGVLGGSFDPVHNGHLGVARAVADALALDRVLLVPAAQAPLREIGVRVEGGRRAEMLRVALAELAESEGERRLEVDERELRRGGTSYTVDTLRGLRAERPADEFTWIVGADQLSRLGAWREPAAGAVWDVSSSEVRARLARGESAAGLVPDKVIEYIRENGLYRAH